MKPNSEQIRKTSQQKDEEKEEENHHQIKPTHQFPIKKKEIYQTEPNNFLLNSFHNPKTTHEGKLYQKYIDMVYIENKIQILLLYIHIYVCITIKIVCFGVYKQQIQKRKKKNQKKKSFRH